MIQSWTARAVAPDSQPLDDDRAVTPGVTTGAVELGSVAGLAVGVWEHSVGTSTDIEVDEVFVVLEGRGMVTDQHGTVIDLAPGVVGILQAGDSTTWVVTEALRKVWVTPA